MKGFKAFPADFAPKPLKDHYDKVARDPKQWPGVAARVKKMVLEFKGMSPDELKAIGAHSLVMMGDREGFRLEHALQMYRLIPNAQLAVFPGTDHFMLWEHPDWVLAMIVPFLDAPVPKAN